MTFIMICKNFSALANIDKRKSTKNFFLLLVLPSDCGRSDRSSSSDTTSLQIISVIFVQEFKDSDYEIHVKDKTTINIGNSLCYKEHLFFY